MISLLLNFHKFVKLHRMSLFSLFFIMDIYGQYKMPKIQIKHLPEDSINVKYHLKGDPTDEYRLFHLKNDTLIIGGKKTIKSTPITTKDESVILGIDAIKFSVICDGGLKNLKINRKDDSHPHSKEIPLENNNPYPIEYFQYDDEIIVSCKEAPSPIKECKLKFENNKGVRQYLIYHPQKKIITPKILTKPSDTTEISATIKCKCSNIDSIKILGDRCSQIDELKIEGTKIPNANNKREYLINFRSITVDSIERTIRNNEIKISSTMREIKKSINIKITDGGFCFISFSNNKIVEIKNDTLLKLSCDSIYKFSLSVGAKPGFIIDSIKYNDSNFVNEPNISSFKMDFSVIDEANLNITFKEKKGKKRFVTFSGTCNKGGEIRVHGVGDSIINYKKIKQYSIERGGSFRFCIKSKPKYLIKSFATYDSIHFFSEKLTDTCFDTGFLQKNLYLNVTFKKIKTSIPIVLGLSALAISGGSLITGVKLKSKYNEAKNTYDAIKYRKNSEICWWLSGGLAITAAGYFPVYFIKKDKKEKELQNAKK